MKKRTMIPTSFARFPQFFDMKKMILYAICLLFLAPTYAQPQLGADIEGKTASEYSGTSVALSADGNRMAVGAPGGATTRVYEWDGSVWNQLGADINGEEIGGDFGQAVSLSADGNRLAVGAPLISDAISRVGYFRIYEWTGSAWSQLGADIEGDVKDDQFGISISLSADGKLVAVGASAISAAGYVRVYEWSGSAWDQLGTTIEGETAGDHFGESVSLSGDGKRLAIGGFLHDGTGADDAGHVRVYEWTGSTWAQLGADIDGEAAQDWSGFSVSLSADGKRLAVGAPGSSSPTPVRGYVRVYEWTGSTWGQLGVNISGEGAMDRSGWSVSLSTDGKRLAVGAPRNSGMAQNAGHARIYECDGSIWDQLGTDIDGKVVIDNLGWSVSLSADGKRVAAGGPFHSGSVAYSGQVRIFSLLFPPKADFSFTSNQLQVDFTDMSTTPKGPITSWAWDFGDGNMSTMQNPSHTYAVSGNFVVCLIANNGNADTICKTVPITNCTIPAGFSNADIGNVSGTKGTACRDANGVYTVTTGGTGIKGLSDGFHFVSKSASGDIDLITRVTSIQNNASRPSGSDDPHRRWSRRCPYRPCHQWQKADPLISPRHQWRRHSHYCHQIRQKAPQNVAPPQL